jgi:hypothetical protein
MALKRRSGKARSKVLVAPEVMTEAVELFRRGLQLQALGAHEIDYDYEERTPEELEYCAIEFRLQWQLLKLPCDLGPRDGGPGQPITGGEGFTRTAPHAREVRRVLMAELSRRGQVH